MNAEARGAYEAHDFRERSIGRGRVVSYFASTPVNGWGVALPRRYSIGIGPWRVAISRSRRDWPSASDDSRETP